MGQEDQFMPTGLNGRCPFNKRTFAGMHADGQTRREQPLARLRL